MASTSTMQASRTSIDDSSSSSSSSSMEEEPYVPSFDVLCEFHVDVGSLPSESMDSNVVQLTVPRDVHVCVELLQKPLLFLHPSEETTGALLWKSARAFPYILRNLVDAEMLPSESLKCAELGSGLGAGAIATALITDASHVYATDHPDVATFPLLRENVDNAVSSYALEGKLDVLPMAWNSDVSIMDESFDLVFSCDCVYVDDALADLVRTYHRMLRPGGVGLFVYERRAPETDDVLDELLRNPKGHGMDREWSVKEILLSGPQSGAVASTCPIRVIHIQVNDSSMPCGA